MSGNGYSFTPLCRAGQGTLYEQFHKDVKGDAPIHDNAAGFKGLSEQYAQSQQAFKAALGGIRTTYTGSAADSMQSAFEPLVNAMGQGQTMTQQASTALTGQAGQFTTAQSKINNTVPVPDEPWYEPIVPWNTDHDDAVDKNNDINNANAAAYKTYGSSTQSNVGTFPLFDSGNSMDPNGIAVTNNQVGSVGNGSGGYSGSGAGGGGGYSAHGVGGGSGGGGGSYQHNGISSDGNQYRPNPVNTPGVPSSTDLQGAGGYGTGNPPGGGSWSGPGGGGGGGGTSGGGFTPGPFGGFPGGGGYGDGTGGGGYGRGGAGGGGFGGARGAMGAGATSGAGAGARPGAGAAAGVGGAEAEGRMGGGPGAAAGARGAAGSNGMMGGQGRGGKKEDDQEHKSAAYLVSEDNEIVGDLPPSLPSGGLIGG